jgi:predicted HTH domain antitoxin
VGALEYPQNMTATPQLDMTTLPPFVSAVEGRLMMALKFFELGRLSLGQAAEVAGYSKRAFIDVLGQYGIPVADYPASELATEVAW